VHYNAYVVVAISNLHQSVDLTEQAKTGKLDPATGRNEGKHMRLIAHSHLTGTNHAQRPFKMCICCPFEHSSQSPFSEDKFNPVAFLNYAMRRKN
jgi:hypothetical protein